MISFKSKGDFSKATRWLERVRESTKIIDFDKYGREGVNALESATPKDTGTTAKSWSYKVINTENRTVISFENSNIQNGIPIAVILQYGHATKNGGWVEGVDYINPAIRPVFDELAKAAWKEVEVNV